MPLRFRISFGAGNVRFNERIVLDILYIDVSDTRMTEVLDPGDPCAMFTQMEQAIEDEVKALIKRGTLKAVKKRKVSRNANVLPSK